MKLVDLNALPGADLFESGVDDLERGRQSKAAALVSMAAPRLRAAGLELPEALSERPGHRLFEILEEDDPATAHSRYNALVGRMTSFARAAERARAG